MCFKYCGIICDAVLVSQSAQICQYARIILLLQPSTSTELPGKATENDLKACLLGTNYIPLSFGRRHQACLTEECSSKAPQYCKAALVMVVVTALIPVCRVSR